MRKRDRIQFLAKVTQLLHSLGATHTEGEHYPFTLRTKAGLLHLHPDENQTVGPGTVYSYFDDPQAARQLVDCNRFSGKWNHHYFDGWTVEAALADLSFWLKRIIP